MYLRARHCSTDMLHKAIRILMGLCLLEFCSAIVTFHSLTTLHYHHNHPSTLDYHKNETARRVCYSRDSRWSTGRRNRSVGGVEGGDARGSPLVVSEHAPFPPLKMVIRGDLARRPIRCRCLFCPAVLVDFWSFIILWCAQVWWMRNGWFMAN